MLVPSTTLPPAGQRFCFRIAIFAARRLYPQPSQTPRPARAPLPTSLLPTAQRGQLNLAALGSCCSFCGTGSDAADLLGMLGIVRRPLAQTLEFCLNLGQLFLGAVLQIEQCVSRPALGADQFI